MVVMCWHGELKVPISSLDYFSFFSPAFLEGEFEFSGSFWKVGFTPTDAQREGGSVSPGPVVNTVLPLNDGGFHVKGIEAVA